MSLFVFAPVLALHTLCTGAGSCAPLVCAWFEYREARGDEKAGREASALATASIKILLLGAVAGAALAWLRWDADYSVLIERLSYKTRWGAVEGVFSIVALAVYVWWRRATPQPRRGARWTRAGLAVLAGANLLYHFPILMVTLARVASGGMVISETWNAAAFRENAMDFELAARVLSFNLAALSMTGALLIFRALQLKSSDQETSRRAAVFGARISLAALVVHIPVFVWTVMALSPGEQYRVLGGEWTATSLAAATAVSGALLIYSVAGVAVGDVRRLVLRLVIGLTLITTLLVTLTNTQLHL